MRREHRKLTAPELRLLTSKRPVIRRIPPPEGKERAVEPEQRRGNQDRGEGVCVSGRLRRNHAGWSALYAVR